MRNVCISLPVRGRDVGFWLCCAQVGGGGWMWERRKGVSLMPASRAAFGVGALPAGLPCEHLGSGICRFCFHGGGLPGGLGFCVCYLAVFYP